MFWFLVETDRWINRATGGQYPQTLSYRWATKRDHGCKWCMWACRMLHWFDPGHCDRSITHYTRVNHLRVDKNDF